MLLYCIVNCILLTEHGDGLSLIQRLAQISLSENERNQHNVDPQTGAIQRKTKCGTDLKERKTAENLHKGTGRLPWAHGYKV